MLICFHVSFFEDSICEAFHSILSQFGLHLLSIFASRALNSQYQAAVTKYLLPQSQAAKKSCFSAAFPNGESSFWCACSTYLIYTFWVLVSEISSWLLLILSDIIYYYGFDNISQKKKYILQVANIQNLTPKHCSTEILLIIFSTQKNGPKKNLRHLDHIIRCIATLYSYLWCYPKLFTIHSTLLDRLDIFFWKKSPQLQGRSLLFRTLGFFFTENTSSSLKVALKKGNNDSFRESKTAPPPKKNEIGKLILNHPPLLSKKSSLDCGCYLSRGCKYILIMLNRLKPNTSETWRASENWHSTTGEHPWHSRHGKNACIHHGAFYTSHEDDEDVMKTAHNSKKVPFNLLGFSCHPTN